MVPDAAAQSTEPEFATRILSEPTILVSWVLNSPTPRTVCSSTSLHREFITRPLDTRCVHYGGNLNNMFGRY